MYSTQRSKGFSPKTSQTELKAVPLRSGQRGSRGHSPLAGICSVSAPTKAAQLWNIRNIRSCSSDIPPC